MQQTFKKIVSGISVKFTRLLYPIRYIVALDDEDRLGKRYTFNNANGTGWKLSGEEPQWLKPILFEVVKLLEENEKKA